MSHLGSENIYSTTDSLQGQITGSTKFVVMTAEGDVYKEENHCASLQKNIEITSQTSREVDINQIVELRTHYARCICGFLLIRRIARAPVCVFVTALAERTVASVACLK